MNSYHKIRGLWARANTKPHQLLVGQFALPEFEQLKDIEWLWTEKIDGTNIRIMWDGNRVSIGGKSNNAQIPVFLLEQLTELFLGPINEQKFEEVFGETPACLYGEGYGRKIQAVGSFYLPHGTDFILFDVKIGNWWLLKTDVYDIGNKLGINVVPTILSAPLQEASDFVAAGFASQVGDLPAEGLVGIPATGLLSRNGQRIITKIKTKDF